MPDPTPENAARIATERRHARRLGALTLAAGALFAVLTLYVVHGSLPHNALSLPGEKTFHVAIVMPESWRFFTRDPKEAQAFVYARTADGGWTGALKLPNGVAANAYGLDRGGRAQNVELALLADGVPSTAWKECTGRPESCFSSLERLPVKNTTRARTICGPIAIARQKPVPWAWANASPPVEMPSQVLALEVEC